ncbi:hypothetical protein L6452_29399 [Arctium lappa]|uniref:Uncharacterized protein n=1 Tax=Arctium lappa TaxID=4217 RepID=A0ACB8ZFU2_ARCLA|nr:hypothetical protein L6452_29399 [Arctium lappa]
MIRAILVVTSTLAAMHIENRTFHVLKKRFYMIAAENLCDPGVCLIIKCIVMPRLPNCMFFFWFWFFYRRIRMLSVYMHNFCVKILV